MPSRPETATVDLHTAWEALAQEADRRLSGRLAVMPQGGAEVSCRTGCAACCRHLVVVSPLEAHALARYVAARPNLAAAVRERLRDYRQRLTADPDLAALLAAFRAARGHLPGSQGGTLEVRYWAAWLPCPFLEDERCSIYPARPFVCREHFVTSDPALCARDPDLATPADTRLEYRSVANWVGEAAFGIQERQILLADALDYAAEHAAEGDRRVPRARFESLVEEAKHRIRLALAAILGVGRGR